MNKIYHFTKLDTALGGILPDMSLRTNLLSKMNDPRENQLWAFSSTNVPYKELYPDSSDFADRQFKLGNDIRNAVQALCFVRGGKPQGYLNEMMWAHYSESHKGLCLEINQAEFIKENAEILLDSKCERVHYGNHHKPHIYFDPNLSKAKNIEAIAKNNYQALFFSKSNYWQKENEFRIILFERERMALSIKHSLRAIYLGLAFPPTHLPSLFRLINKKVKVYDLYFESNKIKSMKRDWNDCRELITRKYLRMYFNS
ncbi:MAG TPA: DUF2971 domain-containing protein [Bacteroidia bacterium]|nr:DUF2971 domain-containing protein [Bacteroidia bacterium]HRH08966.1 DUF2971 domain-containing protein [Bacteroidia bacterium]